MKDIEVLVARVYEVVSRPYPVCLKTLDAAVNTASDSLLEQWILSKPCQTKLLLENLTKRSESDATARSILTRLVGLRSILATLTHYYPEAFDILCRDAVSDIKGSSNRVSIYAPIIQDASLNALPSFKSYIELVTLVVSTNHETSEQHFRRTHEFLASATPRLLYCIPEQIVQWSLESWREQLRSSNPLDALAALDVACSLCRDSGDSPGSSFSSPLNQNATLCQWLERCSSLFQGEKGRSIVETTILTILKWCSEEDPHLGIGGLVGLVQTAQRILQAVEKPVLREWVKTHQSALKKLAQKVSRPEMPSQISLACFGMLAILDAAFELGEWPMLIANGVQHITTCGASTAVLDHAILKTSLKTMLEALDSRIRRTFGKDDGGSSLEIVRSLGLFLLESCRTGRGLSANDCMNMQVAELLVTHLVSMNRCQGSWLPEAILRVLDESALPDWWYLDLGTSGMPEDCGTATVCIWDHESQRLRLRTEVSLLMVEVSSTSRAVISPHNFSILRQLLSTASSLERHVPCQFPQPMSPYSRADTLPRAPVSSCDWKKDLNHRLAESSRQTACIVEGFVCELTKDLQARCDNIEAPLRHARAKAKDLQTALERTEQALQEARDICDQTKQALESTTDFLGQKNMRLEEAQIALSSLQQQYRESRCELHDVQEAMTRQQLNHQQEAEEIQARALAEKTELQRVHDMRASDFEEQLAELHSSVSSLHDENGWLRDEMKRHLEDAGSKHRQEVTQLRDEAQTMQEAAKKHADELKSKVSAMHAENQQLQTELKEQGAEAKGLARSKEDLEAQFKEVSRDLQSSVDETAELRACLMQEQGRVRDLQRERESLTAEQKQQEHRIAELEASEKSWQDECKAYEKALKKARKAEQSVLAIFQKQKASISSPIASRASTVTATATPTPRLPEGSFVSEDDEDYSELIRLGRDA